VRRKRGALELGELGVERLRRQGPRAVAIKS